MKNILVTNDDGVLAPGLLALAHEMPVIWGKSPSSPGTATGLAA